MGSVLFGIAVLAALVFLLSRAKPFQVTTTVYEWQHGLLYLDGRFAQVLAPGRYRTIGLRANREIFTVTKTPQILALAPCDVVSQDGLPFRMSATLTYVAVDPREAYETQNVAQHLQLAVSSALTSLASEIPIHSVLEQRGSVDANLMSRVPAVVAGHEIRKAVVTAITLPPEIRRMASEVERARLEGLAALERARGEHAALRSLNNAARMLKGNPELMNLRVLQAISGTSGKRSTVVLGQNALLPIGGETDRSNGEEQ